MISSDQCRAARGLIGWGVRELAAAAKVSVDTIFRLERGDALKERTLEDVRAAFEKAGVTFIPENGGGAGVRLTNRGPNPRVTTRP